jgi:hypothetical protein
MTNSTVYGNTASAMIVQGGGLYVLASAALTNCTISGNSISGTEVAAGGVEAVTFAKATLENCLIALNTSTTGPDVSGAFTSNGHNLIGEADGSSGFTNGVNGDQIGTVASPLNPKLGPLQNNGGPTQTLALLSGSPAIDAGSDSVLSAPLSLTTDQRGAGFPRKSGAQVDIGAFEAPPPFDTCLKDNATGDLFQWNSTSGAYAFTNCANGSMLTGTGTVSLVNSVRMLVVNSNSLKITASFNTGQRTGSANINAMVAQGVWQLFRIIDTNPTAVCACGG